ncbi:MAG: flagellar protein [Herbinix sp.]|jgi:hypothetical protein|nr:flagellar protein [Herbinix sp.]
MEVRVCKNCRRLFKYIYGPELCQDCIKMLPKDNNEKNDQKYIKTLKPLVKEEEEKFIKVKDFVMAHPRASVVQIAEANEITPTKLLEWIRDERLEFSEDSKYAWFECASCGTKIKSGRLCNRCKYK